jgi:large subunit ribosomal protein L25
MEITGQKRLEKGKKVKHLRNQNLLPGVIFGKGMESEDITIGYTDFRKVFEEVGETNLIDLNIESENYKVLVRDFQTDPLSDKFTHVSFYKPNLTEKVEVNVPVEVVGEEENALVKSGEAVVLTLLQEIPISALPTELKDSFIVDVSNLAEIGEGITVGQLDYDKEKVEIMDIEEEELVVKLDHAQMAEEEETEVSEEELIEGMEATAEAEETDEEGGAEEPKETKEDESSK